MTPASAAEFAVRHSEFFPAAYKSHFAAQYVERAKDLELRSHLLNRLAMAKSGLADLNALLANSSVSTPRPTKRKREQDEESLPSTLLCSPNTAQVLTAAATMAQVTRRSGRPRNTGPRRSDVHIYVPHELPGRKVAAAAAPQAPQTDSVPSPAKRAKIARTNSSRVAAPRKIQRKPVPAVDAPSVPKKAKAAPHTPFKKPVARSRSIKEAPAKVTRRKSEGGAKTVKTLV